ncbi:MAG: 4Fe-4S dicluster domain-containing protein [Planctomycetes bacterium]|nr:4Fe-4S dicluster domain-containing protein [Planctomycetota bacterium]
MKRPKLRELKEAVTSLLKGPYTHPFPAQPTPLPAWIRGRPTYDPEGCIGCGACAEVCPVRAIEVRDEARDDGTWWRTLVLHFDNCVFCGECMRACTTQQGVALSQDYELSGFDRSTMVETVEKQLVVCELCGGRITARDHLAWIHRRLGPVAAANPTLYLATHDALGLRESAPRDGRPLDRSDIQRVLCPACRRSVTLMDEWGPVL